MRGIVNPGFNGNARPVGTGVNAPLDNEGKTALHIAVKNNDAAGLEKLLRVNANPNQQDKTGQSPLFEAIAARNITLAKVLVEKGASFELRDDKKRTALDWAIEKECDVEFIAQLKSLGADPALPAIDNRRTAMHLAAEKNRPDLIAFLHASGLSLNQQDSQGATPLHIAVASKSIDALQKLVELKADATVRNNQIETPLHTAAITGNAAAADVLLSLPEVRRTVNEHRSYGPGYTPLLAAVSANQPALIEKLCAIGGNVNQTDNQNRNSLFIAVELGHIEAAKLLIKLGADCAKADTTTGYYKNSMVHAIGDKNYAEMLLLLHNAGFDINAKDGSGNTALNKAADQQNKAKMKALLDLGANPNIASDFGRRPIDTIMDNYTYSYGDQKELVGMLAAKGADVGMSPHAQMMFSPLHLAARNGKVEDMKLVLSRNVPVDQPARTPDGMTPLMLAAENGKADAVSFLISQGADALKKDNYGRTAISFAASGGSEKAIDALLAVPGMKEHLDDQDNRGRTALHEAFLKYHNDTGIALLKKGARADIFDNDGLTALHQAIVTSYMGDYLQGFRDALGDKADWNQKTRDGDTPLILAARHNQAGAVEKLLELGADPAVTGRNGVAALHQALLTDNATIANKIADAMKAKNIPVDQPRDTNGWGVLHYAAVKDNGIFVQQMLDRGADVNAVTNDGDTPLMLAARAGKTQSVTALLMKGADALAENSQGQTALDIAMTMKRADIAQAVMMVAAQQQAAKQAAASKDKDADNDNKPAPPALNNWKPFKPGQS